MSKTYRFLLTISFITGTIIGYGYMAIRCPDLETTATMKLENRELRKFINARCAGELRHTCTNDVCQPGLMIEIGREQ